MFLDFHSRSENFTCCLLLLLKDNEAWKHIFYLVHSHILILWMKGKFFISSLIIVAHLNQLPPAMHVQPNCVHFPKSSPPLAEDDVIISHLILQIIPLSQQAEMASREEWLQSLNNLHRERELNQICGVDWQHI